MSSAIMSQPKARLIHQQVFCGQTPGDTAPIGLHGHKALTWRQGDAIILSLSANQLTLLKSGKWVGQPSKSLTMLQNVYLFLCSNPKGNRNDIQCEIQHRKALIQSVCWLRASQLVWSVKFHPPGLPRLRQFHFVIALSSWWHFSILEPSAFLELGRHVGIKTTAAIDLQLNFILHFWEHFANGFLVSGNFFSKKELNFKIWRAARWFGG